jgi:peptidoglycan/LPS O-acetylase OafA/YrhL
MTLADGAAIGLPGHYWSLAVEEHFYLLWPLLVYLAPLRRLMWLSWIVIAGALAVRWAFLFRLGLTPFYFTLCRIDALGWGTVLACMEAGGQMLRFRKVFSAALFVLLPALAIGWTRFADQGANWLQLVKYTLVGGTYWACIGLAVCCQDQKWVRWTLAGKPLRFCGKVSYGLYIYQGITLPLVGRWIPPGRHGPIFLIVLIVLTLLISWLSFRFIESWFLSLKRFFDSERPAALARLPTHGRRDVSPATS